MDTSDVQLRRLPYPYRAALAICSDLDETPDRRAYWEIMRFLNTTEATTAGPGVGLEVGNTIYFDMRPDQFAYWNTDDTGRAMVRALIRSGHVDCLHSYGDLAVERAHAGRALDELDRHDCRLEVWIDHATAPTNFGADIMHGHGDEPGHAAYHADLTVGHGIRYVWRGRVTSVIGQDVPARFAGLWTARHPVASARTVAKERMKHIVGRRDGNRYEMNAANRVLRPARLRDGRAAYEFLRSNPHWGGVSCGDTSRGIGPALTEAFLDHLTDREGVCVLYTHLGKTPDPAMPIDETAAAGFRRLAEKHRAGRILVTTTRRLLRLCRAIRELSLTVSDDARGLRIDLQQANDVPRRGEALTLSDLAGLTVYVPEPPCARLCLNGSDVPGLQRNGNDHTGRRSVSIPWRPLEFPGI